MKFCFRLQLYKKNKFKKIKHSSNAINNLFNHNDNNKRQEQNIERSINQLNDSKVINDKNANDRKILFQQIPMPVDEQQIVHAQDKVDRLMKFISDTYEKTLIRNLRLEELDVRSTDLFRDAEKMKNMAHKMQNKFFWEDKYCLIVIITSVSAIILGGLVAFVFLPKITGK